MRGPEELVLSPHGSHKILTRNSKILQIAVLSIMRPRYRSKRRSLDGNEAL